MNTKTIAVIGGLGELAGADLYSKLIHANSKLCDQTSWNFFCEQRPFKDARRVLESGLCMTSRKLYVFKTCQSFADRNVDAILLPCFASHVFRDEIQSEFETPLLDMMFALSCHVRRKHAPGSRLGILTSDFVRQAGLFERYLGDDFTLAYPASDDQSALMDAVYGRNGIKFGPNDVWALDCVADVCKNFLKGPVDVLLPGFTELSLLTTGLSAHGIHLPDINEIYVNFALRNNEPTRKPPFKLGILGGVGPSATVDFMNKVIRNTPAKCDQEHIKIVVEQNPQIPDRTASLLHGETDPTVALLATCKRLETDGAQIIAIPCNTAHAFVQAIQPHLTIPIVNMLEETIAYIKDQYGSANPIGLLATQGTVSSAVYHAVAGKSGLKLIVPDQIHQNKVMNVIYADYGVKAGFTNGLCKIELLEVIAHLVGKGAKVILLGCTELPLVLHQSANFKIGNQTVALVDPTEILAQACVRLSKQ